MEHRDVVASVRRSQRVFRCLDLVLCRVEFLFQIAVFRLKVFRCHVSPLYQIFESTALLLQVLAEVRWTDSELLRRLPQGLPVFDEPRSLLQVVGTVILSRSAESDALSLRVP